MSSMTTGSAIDAMSTNMSNVSTSNTQTTNSSSTSTTINIKPKISLIPIHLTNEQIKEILAMIPPLPGVGRTAQKFLKNDLLTKLYDVLITIKLVPVPEAYAEFKEEILRSFMSSLIEPGRPVGVSAGVSIGAPVTQLTLNSFHFAGSRSGVANAFDKIKGLITGTKTIKVPQTNIFFKVVKNDLDMHTVLHKCSIDDILDRKSVYEQTTLFDLALDTEIIYRDDAIREGLVQMIEIQSILRPNTKFDLVHRQKLTAVMKIKLDSYRMYTHKITMKMVADAIEGPPQNPDVVTCVWKSLNHGFIYVLVDESLPYGKNLKTETGLIDEIGGITVFLNRAIKDIFKQLVVKGIPGIIYLEPKSVNVITGIYKIVKTANSYQVYSNNLRTRWVGISLADMKQLFERAGFVVNLITDLNKENLYIDVVGTIGANGVQESFDPNVKLDLEKIIKKKIEEATKIIEKRKKPVSINAEMLMKKIIEKDANDLLIEASTFTYAEAHGSNMKELVWVEEIDVYRTINNNPHEIAEINGIDAARIYLIFKFREVLQSFSSAINGRHIALIFDMLTNMGYVNNLSFSGTNRKKIGALALASNERAAEVFMKAGTFGSKESMNSVAPSVFIGKQPNNIGTGLVQILEDDVEQEDFLISVTSLDTNSDPGLNVGNLADILTGEIISGSSHENIFETVANEQIAINKANKVDKPLEVPLASIGSDNVNESKSIFSFEDLQSLSVNSLRPSPALVGAIEKTVQENKYVTGNADKCVEIAPTTGLITQPQLVVASSIPISQIKVPRITNINPPKILMPIIPHIPRKPGVVVETGFIPTNLPPVAAIVTKAPVSNVVLDTNYYLNLFPSKTEIISATQERKKVEPLSFSTYTNALNSIGFKK